MDLSIGKQAGRSLTAILFRDRPMRRRPCRGQTAGSPDRIHPPGRLGQWPSAHPSLIYCVEVPRTPSSAGRAGPLVRKMPVTQVRSNVRFSVREHPGLASSILRVRADPDAVCVRTIDGDPFQIRRTELPGARCRKVSGELVYGSDLRLPGMLYAQLVLSPHAHATVGSIDTKKALSVPGVVGVYSYHTAPSTPYCRYRIVPGQARCIDDETLFASTARFVGDPSPQSLPRAWRRPARLRG
jgi:hypothetical protein